MAEPQTMQQPILNEPQQRAVEHFEGPILVLAGAGSGKTRVLTHRIAHLVQQHRVPPQQILAVTFTNKATDEMRERLRRMLGDRAEQLWVATFHSAGLRILRRHARLLDYGNDFVVYDDQDSKGVLKTLLKESGLDEKKFPPSMFARVIDQAKNAFILPDEFEAHASDYATRQQADIYRRYQQALQQSNAMDFGDLLVNAVVLLQRHPEVLRLYQEQLRFVLVDEFQDTNTVQYRMVQLLTAKRRNLLVVGDDDQSIYAFRGATIRNILDFEKDFPDAKVVTLDQNYRSTGRILEAAHAVISRNTGRKPKKLWTASEQGAPLTTFVAMDESDEAFFIAQEIRALQQEHGYDLRDIAIFYRTNAQSRALEEALMNARLPYRIFGGLRFYDRKEIRDVLGYLRLIVNEQDNQAFLRIVNTPTRGIGAQTLRTLATQASAEDGSLMRAARRASGRALKGFVTLIDELQQVAQRAPLSELIRQIVQRTEYAARLEANGSDPQAESRLENLRELEAIGRSMEGQGEPIEVLRKFLDRVSLTSSAELPNEEAAQQQPGDTVSLMTLHLAKGLEFPVVFLTGLEEGLLPHHRSIYDPSEIEEERRLCYVGITRAMQRLYLTRAIQRGMFSAGDGFGLGGMFREPSRFAYDLPEDCLEHRSAHFISGSSYGLMEPHLSMFDEPIVAPEFSSEPPPRPQRTTKLPPSSAMIVTADKLGAKALGGNMLVRRKRRES